MIDPGAGNPIDGAVQLLWCVQLYNEWESIEWSYRLGLRRPVIRIAELAGSWGRWDASTRAITIGAELIREHSWDVVVEVLKHEVAHQLVSEVYGRDEAHGVFFRAACDRLGIAGWAAAPSGELPRSIPSWRDRATTKEEERLLGRVEKLLALATSSNEHEALAAMERVQRLYTKYNLDRARAPSGGPKPEMVHWMLCEKRKRVDRVRSMIYSILTGHFFVRVIYRRIYDAADLCRYQAIEILGTRENVLMAEYVHGFLTATIQSLWQAHREATKKPGSARPSYQAGLLAGFRKKLEASDVEREALLGVGAARATSDEASNGRALVRLEKELDDFVATRHPRLGTRSRSSARHDASSFAAGMADGARITLHKGIEGDPVARGRFLPSGER